MIQIVKEIIAQNNLIRELVLKDLRMRYSRPLLGFFWAFLSPFIMAVVLYLVFSLILKIRIEEMPFFLYLMSALLPWNFFQSSLMGSVSSLVDNKNIIKEAKFPCYFIPFSVTLANGINLLPSLAVLVVIACLVLKGVPVFIIFVPVLLMVHFIITASLGIILSILYTKWRDIKYVLEVLLLILFYSMPVFYSLNLVQISFKPWIYRVYNYNPFVGILNLYRALILKGYPTYLKNNVEFFSYVILPLIFAIVIMIISIIIYRRNKNKINDYISY